MSIGELIGAFFTHSGPGGIVLTVVILTAAIIYYRLTRWILSGGSEEDRDLFR